MEVKIEIPKFSRDTGITYLWTEGFELNVTIDNNVVIIKANKEGLISMANHLLNLAQDGIPKNHHMHFDEFSSLEGGLEELIIEKI
ncbi:hypothetical protein HQN83_00630 [Pedobacter sp. LMG 31643]|nr:hypothetical protein [Pedobacter foliorum]